MNAVGKLLSNDRDVIRISFLTDRGGKVISHEKESLKIREGKN